MVVADMQKDQKGIIKKITASSDLKRRLNSFGIIKGATVTFLAAAPKKSTIEIEVANMRIALRKEEAQTIEVDLL